MIAAKCRHRSVTIINTEAIDHLAYLERIVIDETDGQIIPLRVVAQLAKDHLAAVAGPVDKNSAAIAGTGYGQHLANKAKGETAAHEREKQNDAVEDKDRPREVLKPVKQQDSDDAKGGAVHNSFAEG